MRGRPELRTSYAEELAALDTTTKRVALAVGLVLLVLAPAVLTSELESLMTWAFVAAIGAIGLNLVTGYAGQVSLGHAFFLGVGAYTAAALGGQPSARLIGLGLDMYIWLPAAGLAAAVIGLVVGPVATRLKGLYLAIVTLGLVFIGEHIFREFRSLTGGPGVGRSAAVPAIAGFRFDRDSELFGFEVSGELKLYLLCLALLVVMAVAAKNLARSKIGRAFAAVRDRDIAAEVMGVALTRYKVIAFTISSFYAGIAGALLSITAQAGFVEPTGYNLVLSVQYLAMILIGGMATISGSLLGAGFVVLLPRAVQELPRFLPFLEQGSTGGFLTTFQLNTILFGVLIVVFLILEPRGLYGLWVRVRNYFRAWPFSY